jgi:nucleoside-diphosphate-sugar epimerase
MAPAAPLAAGWIRMTGTILVTGADGFIGKHLVAALRIAGYSVQPHSLADGDLVRCSLPYAGVFHAFHLAGRTFVPESWIDPAGFYAANVVTTANVLEFCRRSGASLTFVSSYVYGSPGRIPIAEDHPVQAFNPYSHSKILAEQVCRFCAEQHGTPVSIVRPFNVFGPGQDERFLIPTLVRQALKPDSDRIEVADVRPRRDFLYISDLIKLLIATIGRDRFDIYNAGSGVSTSIQEVVTVLNDIVGRPKKVVSRGESRPGEIFNVVADISKAERDLQWRPQVDLATGLREMVQSTLGRGNADAGAESHA